MKKHKLFFYLIVALFVYSCTGDDDIDNTPKLGLLKSVESYFNGELSDNTEISYDEDHRLTSLKQLQGNFATLTYNVKYLEEEVKSIIMTHHWYPQHADTTIVEIYDVTYQDHEIILTHENTGYQRIFKVTDGYVDSYNLYWGPENAYLNESVFARDANNNIKSISYYVTNASDTNLLVWKHTFSDFDTNAKLNSAFNPVFYYSGSLYNPFIGAVLNLEVSKDTPLKSSYLDSNGIYKEENVTTKTLDYEYGLLKNISYEYFDYPENDHQLELSYY